MRIILDYDSGLGANEHWLGINSEFKRLGQPCFSRMMVSMLIVFGLAQKLEVNWAAAGNKDAKHLTIVYYLFSTRVGVAGLNCLIYALCNNYASKLITQLQFLD